MPLRILFVFLHILVYQRYSAVFIDLISLKCAKQIDKR